MLSACGGGGGTGGGRGSIGGGGASMIPRSCATAQPNIPMAAATAAA